MSEGPYIEVNRIPDDGAFQVGANGYAVPRAEDAETCKYRVSLREIHSVIEECRDVTFSTGGGVLGSVIQMRPAITSIKYTVLHRVPVGEAPNPEPVIVGEPAHDIIMKIARAGREL